MQNITLSINNIAIMIFLFYLCKQKTKAKSKTLLKLIAKVISFSQT